MRIITCDQRSDEWWEVRRGIPTASSFAKIVTGNGAASKQREGYLYTLAAERISGVSESTFVSDKMLEGIEREAESRAVYAMQTEAEVVEAGFCIEDGGRWGCSSDGLVGDDGMVELKNPMGKTAIEYLLKGEVPSTYIVQVQGQLFVTGRLWCDFVSYYPNMPLLVVRVTPDEALHQKLEEELVKFAEELNAICEVIERQRC